MHDKKDIQHKVTRMRNVLRLSGKLKPYKTRIAGAVVSGIGHQLSNVGVSVIAACFTGLAITGRLQEQIRLQVLLLILFVLAKIVFYFAEMWLAHDVAFKVLADFRIQAFNSIERVSPGILLDMRSGQLASTMMSDIELLEWFFAHTFGSVLVAIVVPVILMICLGNIYPLLPLILILFLCVLLWIPFRSKQKADEQGIQVREQLADANAVTIEGIQGMKEILALNSTERYLEKNSIYMERFYKTQLSYGKRLGTEGALLQGTLGVSMLAVTAVTAAIVQSGRIDSVWYPVIVILAGTVLGPVVDVCNVARNFGLIFAAADRVYRVLEAVEQVTDTAEDMDITELVPSVTFDHVSFGYHEGADDTLKDVSFTVEPGETVALVGYSGAGKSTCMNLLLRYWDVRKGAVRIGNCDLKKMSLNNLHQMTSVVLQDVYLFRESIRENIRLGKPDATDEEVELVAKHALAHDFIMELPEGYDTVAGESGSKLSGGQRQRIAIARALLKDAPILLLDEAVSNLDAENEKEIQQSIKNSSRNRTTVIIAHRLSTIRSADKIVVLCKGRVIQTGTFEKLTKEDGFFRKLISSQYEMGKIT
jgi:ATP-binding cassette subfamily B protein